MTEAQKEAAMVRLLRKLAITDPSADVTTLLGDELEDAEAALLLYLNREELPVTMHAKVVALAALYYQRDTAGAAAGAVKSSSYSEGSVSQSESYLDAADYAAAEQEILNSLAKYREVRIR